jgi:hypothetical protein
MDSPLFQSPSVAVILFLIRFTRLPQFEFHALLHLMIASVIRFSQILSEHQLLEWYRPGLSLAIIAWTDLSERQLWCMAPRVL